MENTIGIIRELQGIIGVMVGVFGAHFLRRLGKIHMIIRHDNYQYIQITNDGQGGFIEKIIKPEPESNDTLT